MPYLDALPEEVKIALGLILIAVLFVGLLIDPKKET